MKVEVNEIENEDGARKYPYLGVYSDGEVVLFTSPQDGVVVNSACDRLGHYSKAWADRSFSLFKGSITLSND